jgi:glutathione S-transferase
VEPRQLKVGELITFYTTPVSNFAAKVEIALRLKGIAFAAVPPPGGYGSAAYKALVPAGTIPAIVHDGLVLSESETIVEYLEEAFPEPPLLPEGAAGRARCRQLARFHDTRLEPPLRALFPHMAPGGRDPAFVARQLGLFATRLADLALMAAPAPWLAGPTLTLADLPYPPTLSMARLMLEHLDRTLRLPPVLEDWHALAVAHPAIGPVLAAQEAAQRAWLRAKS